MSLASLTVDLTMNLARFESDSGRAAQIVTRDADKMSRAQRSFLSALERTAERVGKTEAEYLRLKAATLGVSEAAEKYITAVEGTGSAAARVGAQGSAAFQAVAGAVESAGAKQTSVNARLVESIKAVNAAYNEQRQKAIAAQEAGSITPDTLKVRLSGLGAGRADAIDQLRAAAQQEEAAKRVADTESAEIARRRAAMATLNQSLTGVSASYARNLEVIRASFKAGEISSEEFQRAVTRLNQQQNPLVKFAREQEAAAERVAAANTAAGQAFIRNLQEQIAAIGRTREETLRLQAAKLGVSQQAEPSIVGLGQREFVVGIDAQIAAQRQLAAEFGKTESEVLALRAAERGLTNETAAAIAQLSALKRTNSELASAKASADSNSAFIASLEREVAAIGKTRSELIALDAAHRGVTTQAAPLVARIAEAEKNMGKFGIAAAGAGARAKITAYELQTLSYTASDVVASLASGISPLTILLQQGGQVRDVFGSFGAVFAKVGALFTPFRVLVGASAGAVAALTYAMYQGAKQSREFADAVVLSGNYAGQTEGQFNALTRSISASGEITAAAARDFGQALIGTGEIGVRNFNLAAEAAARFGQATGKSSKDVATEFAAMERDVTAGAKKLNDSFNFLSLAQFEQIRSFQEQGRSADALGIVYEALNGRLRKLEPNLGTLDRVLRGVSHTWAAFWDAAFDIGRTETIESKLENVQSRLAAAQASASQAAVQFGALSIRPTENAPVQFGAYTFPDNRIESLRTEERELFRQQEIQQGAAAAAAATAEVNKRGIEASGYVEGFLKRAKSVESLNKALTEARSKFADLARAGNPVSEANQKIILDQIRKDFTPAAPKKDREAEQVRKAELEQALKTLQNILQRERDTIQFNNQQVQALYSAGEVSLRDFYTRRNAEIDSGVAKELETLAKSRAAEEKFRDETKDPSERIKSQTRINELVDETARVELEASRARSLTTIEQQEAYRALGNRVAEFRAQILQLQGDESGAARVRAAQAIETARIFSRQAGGGVDVESYGKAIQAANQFAEVQRQVGIASADASRAEARFVLQAEQGNASLMQTEQGVYAIRSAALAQLGELVTQAKALADASTDPRVKEFADDLALQYQIAADSVDPALNRLREANRSAAQAIASDIGEAIISFTSFRDVVDSVEQTLLRLSTKVLITDPLEKGLEGVLKSVTEGNNPIAEMFRGTLGIGGAGSGQTAQTAAIATQTSTLSAAHATSTAAVTSAIAGSTAAIVSAITGSAVASSGGKLGSVVSGGLTTGDFSRMDRAGSSTPASGGGGFMGAIGSFFASLFHTGGVVGSAAASRSVSSSTFAGATRYHTGGLAGLKPDEVPAILMGGPRGKREEVLRANDPRHRDNGGAGGSRRSVEIHAPVNVMVQGNPDSRTLNQIGAAAQRGINAAARNT